ncbi:alpha-glucuronidase [uncultured Bacteroides sp.]|uniref:alpha-glucuronidase n=1 Tax=uncultured Bacteroides sp. TaxID=162156 RepID=UPI00262595FE|nr:alpha-glucuronidase [uncultured Bacteroides sp.]
MISRILLGLFFCGCGLTASAENGSNLWLRQEPSCQATVVCDIASPVIDVARKELASLWKGGEVILRISADREHYGLGDEGYTIRSAGNDIILESSAEKGLLYAAYHLLRLQAEGNDCKNLNISESPLYEYRILNHWDNIDGTVERGYAGKSLWKWEELPTVISPAYEKYARANASVGINGTVLNNVNASVEILSDKYLDKVKVLSDIFRPYGIKVYLSVNFASPMKLGGLDTADPMDEKVAEWWKRKVHEIYSLIPDFGGFLVKANSEGQPGPCDYGRTHAQGANMLASALKPYGGIVMWRAFVYSPTDDDRAKQAYLEFKPLDGKFLDNVIVQVKNGPIDFQPREPYSPLFGSMPHTPLMVEFQITQEYLGHSNHLAYLAPMWKEFYEYVSPYSIKAVAGVANIGDDVNWCGHDFAQSNWYAFGRLAWNPELSSSQIAREWLVQTFTDESEFLNPVEEMMLESREAVVDYMMPLGLHHIFAWNHHYGPEPWCEIPGARADWLPSYYHCADREGIGFDRTTTGSDAVSQYPDSLAAVFNSLSSCPEEFLLWFHHVSWDHKLKSGNTLWDELCYKYQTGVEKAQEFCEVWNQMSDYVDSERYQAIANRLKIQADDAVWWKDACLEYFRTFSRMKYPSGVDKPVFRLKELKKVKLPISNYECPSEDILPRK